MKHSKLFLYVMAGLLTVACSNDSDISNGKTAKQQEPPVEIKLGSYLNAVTRAYTATQGDVITTNETVYAWIDDAGSTTPSVAASEYVKGWTLAAGAKSGTSQPLTSSNKYYFPNTGRNINIYAVHGNFNNAVTEGTTTWSTFVTSLTHSVETAQNTTGNYDKSDLFCAHLLDKSKTATLELPFKHVLSKVEVYLFRGTGVSASDLSTISSITLLGSELTGNVTLTKPTNTTTEVASVTAATGNPGNITMKLQTDGSGVDMTTESAGLTGFSPADDDKKAYAYGEAIIIPQTIGDTTTPTPADFISVNFLAGGALVAKVAQAFTAGNRYTYFIVVNRTGLTLTATLTDWTSGGTTPGTAE